MITGCLQQKNGLYYAVLYLKVDGKRKPKWISTKLPIFSVYTPKVVVSLIFTPQLFKIVKCGFF